MFKVIDKELGSLFGLVNNASITARFFRVVELGHATTQQVMDMNIVDCMMTMREAVSLMSTVYDGSVEILINISSIESLLGSPSEYAHYAVSKGDVNTILPGIVDTETHASSGRPSRFAERNTSMPMGRDGNPDKITNAVMWLLDEKNTFTNGACIPVPGGI
jgi:NAD(P)-dependent dehydrogenase (short-subunit alcohol dehydrogenase family)